MYKRKFKFLVLFLSSLPFCLLAQSKIGYIDSNQIMSRFDEVRGVQKELEKEQKRLEAEYYNLQSSLDSLFKNYENKKLLMKKKKQKQAETQIRDSKKRLEQFQQDKLGPNGEIPRLEKQLMEPVMEQISRAIEKVGKNGGYDFILDAASGGLLWGEDNLNLTDQVLKELKK